MGLNHTNHTLSSLGWKADSIKGDSIKWMLKYLLRIENLLAAQLSCPEHHERFSGCGDRNGSWAYVPLETDTFIEMLTFIQKREKEKFQWMKFLDVGCGLGSKVWLANRMGMEAHGIDFCKGYVEMAKDIFDGECRITIKKKNALRFKEYDQYDVIYMYQPIANAVDMAKLMKRVATKMKPGAYFFGRLYGVNPIDYGLENLSHNTYRKN